MKINFILAWIGILPLLAILPSCNKDNDVFYEISTTINSLTFDSIRDSYGERVKNTDYKFTIDLEWKTDTALIYNSDSLPYRSDLTRTLLTYSSSATIYRLTGDNNYELFISKQDTLDVNQPVILKAVGSDAYGNVLEQIYKVTFNVHQVNPDLVTWQKFSPDVSIEGKHKSLLFNEKIFLFMENGTILSAPLSNAEKWTRTAPNVPFDYSSATVFAGRIYLASTGNVLLSTDGINWTIEPNLSADNDIETLLGSTDYYLAGIKNGHYSTTTGMNWETGRSANGFKRTWPSSVTYPLTTNSKIQQVALLGVSSTNPVASSLLVAEENLLNWATWGPVDSTAYQLPNDPRMALIRYRDHKFYSFGGSDDTSFQYYYTSDGLYWTPHTNHTFFPSEFSRRADFSALVDPENYIWIVFSESPQAEATIYKGRFNSYNF